MDYDTALAELADMVAATSEPTLGERVVEQLLARARRPDAAGNPPTNQTATAASWAASTAYPVGAVVLVAGRYWRALEPGTSAGTAPAWPDMTTTTGSPSGNVVHDGTVRWIDNGTEWAPTWDLNAAAAIGWDMKAAKAVGSFDFMTGDQQFMRSQIGAGCREQARTYRARIVGSALIGRG